MREKILSAIADRSLPVGVVGLGYVGLPLAKTFVSAGFPVCGFDVDSSKVRQLENGESYISRVSSEWLSEAIREKRFQVTEDLSRLGEMGAILICVPTPLNKTREPDLSFVRQTCEEVRRHLVVGQIVVLESTTYPGTTDELIDGILGQSGMTCGADYFVAFSPEREDPGNPDFTTSTIPKLVGGVDEVSGEIAFELYDAAVQRVIRLSNARVAEAAKILENIYRAVNIALVNELKMLFDQMDIDIWEVISAASTKPFGFQAFYPGPGLGGHCIPIDPFYLTWKAREFDTSTRFIELAGEINTQMPRFVVGKVTDALNRSQKTLNGSNGLIIGVAYKPNIEDVRESPAFKIMELLQQGGSDLSFHDPFVKELPSMRHYDVSASPVDLTEDTLRSCDFALIVTNHDGIDWQFVVDYAPIVVDTRNATRHVKSGREKIVMA